jgi:hypothetical protein
MKKDQFFESIDNIKEQLEELEFKALTNEQRRILSDRFNTSIDLEYSAEDDFIFIMSISNFKAFEYYCGMEYEKDDIEYKCELDGIICVSYNSGNDRVARIIDLIDCDEEEE